RLKESFTRAPVLSYFHPWRRTVVETDASEWAVGGVISQYDDNGDLHPVGFYSSKHTPAEANYEIYDKELLAIIKALEEWRPELQGPDVPFEIIMDHKNLQYFMTTKLLTQRQARWAEFLSQFNFQIVYRSGKQSVKPDALSRRPWDTPSKLNTTDSRVAARQQTILRASRISPGMAEERLYAIDTSEDLDDLIDMAYSTNHMAKKVRFMRVPFSDCKLRNGRIFYHDKLFIPENDHLRSQIQYRTHALPASGHPGGAKTAELIKRNYWWPGMYREISGFVGACHTCRRAKGLKESPQGLLHSLTVPYRPWSDISVDYITGLPDYIRHEVVYKHIFVVVDRLTKMRYSVAVNKLDVPTMVDAFVHRVFSLHGSPEFITSDRGSQFVSQFWQRLAERLGSRLKPSSAYHPSTNGQTEIINSVLEQYLRIYISLDQDDWVDHLPLTEFALNNTVSSTTKFSPFFANYGWNARLGIEPPSPRPPDLSRDEAREWDKADKHADLMKNLLDELCHNMARAQEDYEYSENIVMQRPSKKLSDKWLGPFAVLRIYKCACALELDGRFNGIFPVFHHSLLRPVAEPRTQDQVEINDSQEDQKDLIIVPNDKGRLQRKWVFDKEAIDAEEEDTACIEHDEEDTSAEQKETFTADELSARKTTLAPSSRRLQMLERTELPTFK
ncbi:Uu.00g134840.m01.CDS01, partial [Anthostomella pinea]